MRKLVLVATLIATLASVASSAHAGGVKYWQPGYDAARIFEDENGR